MDAAAGLNTGGGAQVQHHVVVRLAPEQAVGVVVSKVVVEGMAGVFVAHVGEGVMGQAREAEGGSPEAHPGHRVQTHVVPGVELGQKLGSQVLGQWRELRVEDNVVQLFGQQFAVQVDVRAVPGVKREAVRNQTQTKTVSLKGAAFNQPAMLPSAVIKMI